MSVPTDRLRDKRPAFYSIYKADFRILQTIAARQRPYAIAAYNVLAFHANTETDIAFPSYKTIAQLSGMSRRQAVEMVTLLVSVGLVTLRHRQDEKGDPTSNEYTLVSVVHTAHYPVQGVPDPGADDAPPLVQGMHPNENEEEQDKMNEGLSPTRLRLMERERKRRMQ